MIQMRAVQGDITQLQLDAIVNAANKSLLGGSGVDGAIHRAAGPKLYEACRTLGGCEVGQAKITPGFALPSRFVIHTVGPVWHGGKSGEPELLVSCYRASLELAEQHQLHSIAFPCISTGAYGYPPDLAAALAAKTVREFETSARLRVLFCCFHLSDLAIYEDLLRHR